MVKYLFSTLPLTLLSLFLITTTTPLKAQSKTETKLYNSSITKGDIKSLNKFIAKYPTSVYIPTIKRKIDSLEYHSINQNSHTDLYDYIRSKRDPYFEQLAINQLIKISKSKTINAKDIASKIITEDTQFSIAINHLGKEKILSLITPTNNSPSYTIKILEQENDNWKESHQITEPINTTLSNDFLFLLYDTPKAIFIKERQYIHYSYVTISTKISPLSGLEDNIIDFTSNLLDITSNTIFSALYCGYRDITQPFDINNFKIHGHIRTANIGAHEVSNELTYLYKYLYTHPSLLRFDESKIKSQYTIEWWYNNNPEDYDSVTLIPLLEEDELVKEFKKYKDSEKMGDWIINYYNILKNTVVIGYNTKSKEYSLIWCQQLPKKKGDKELQSIYHEKGNIMTIYNYIGKTSQKIKINLSTKKIIK